MLKDFFKKQINKIILLLIILNFLVIYFVIIRSYKSSTTIQMNEGNLVSEVNIDYEVQANPLSKIKIQDLTKTEAEINECVGNVGQSIDISGNFFNFQLKEATVTMKYDKEKLEGVDEEDLGILWYDEKRDEMITMESKVDTENSTIQFTTNHFSEYIVVNLEEWEAAWNQRVVRVRNDADSFDISFVIDDSGSMTSNDPQKLRIEAVENFINILRDQDKYSIIKFEDSAKIIKNLNNEANEEWKDNFRSSGGTNITNGVTSGIETLSEENDNFKVLVLLTDGEDSSLPNKKQEIIDKAIDKNITIYTIFLNTGNNTNDNRTEHISDIAVNTGGSFYTISTDEIIDIFKQISKVSVGIDGSVDTDKDGIPDEIELGGMRNKSGHIVYTNPYSADTDGDGLSDKEEVGEIAETFFTKKQYYKMPTDPATPNQKKVLYSFQGPNKDNAIGVWDSGFKLNKNAFRFDNLMVRGVSGVCVGISYVTEHVFNGDGVDKIVNNEILHAYNHTVSTEGNYTKEAISEAVKDDPYSSINEKDSKDNQVNLISMTKGYELKDSALDIIFDKGLPYFYLPNSEEMKVYRDTNNDNNTIIPQRFIEGDSADAQLVNCFFYYWLARNEDVISMLVNDDTYDVDIQNQVTEDTIQQLKVIFNNKKIVTLHIRDKFYHTLNAYALEKKSETKYRLYLYDNESPYMFKNNNYIEFQKINGTNRYSIHSDYITTDDQEVDKDGTIIEDDRERTLVIEYNEEFINFKK